MADPISGLLDERRRANWVRLRTLIVLRWIAVTGQLSAVMVASSWFDLDLPVGLCLMAIGASVVANVASILFYPENKRLPEREVAAALIFDITQLSVLLYLTGGLSNPFALLILAPVTISATTLRPKSTVIVGSIAILLITIVARFHLPLMTDEGFVLRLPLDFVFGFWIAIVIGVTFLATYAWRVTSEIHSMSEALLATQMALAREQKLTDLGGVVAAAAHELGTPLATIKLVSSELMEDLSDDDLRADARLIREQADRCRDILRSMGRTGKDDMHLRKAPVATVLREAAEPHMDRGKQVEIDTRPLGGDARQPLIFRRPEIIHGLRTLIQNAVDFADARIEVRATWTDERLSVRIADDGPGFPAQVIGRIGEPFVRRRRGEVLRRKRPEYEGMGLGLFIAKTLLERTGAELTFANGTGADGHLPKGAVVEVAWPRRLVGPDHEAEHAPLGPNVPIEA